jgi:peptidoglycan/xylan/chitin deacetylase (PgdA/CDA1 family)
MTRPEKAPSITGRISRQIAVLMYHGVHGRGSGPLNAREPVDRVYGIPVRLFSLHLEELRIRQAISVFHTDIDESGVDRESVPVCLTFDDGLASHADTVMPMLVDRELKGMFFVNTATLGKPGYLDALALREMQAAGMSIQSHGHSHCYISALPPARQHEQLRRSKDTLEQILGQPVTAFAAPGGRVSSMTAALAMETGYRTVFGSRPGYWNAQTEASIAPRFPVRASTTAATLGRWVDRRTSAVFAAQVRHSILQTAKNLVGNAAYDRVRKTLIERDFPSDGHRPLR